MSRKREREFNTQKESEFHVQRFELNSTQISTFVEVIRKKYEQYKNKFEIFDPSFFQTKIFKDKDKLKEFVTRKNLNSKEMLFFPICVKAKLSDQEENSSPSLVDDGTDRVAEGNHWVLVILILHERTMFIYDSLTNDEEIKSENIYIRNLMEVLNVHDCILNTTSKDFNLLMLFHEALQDCSVSCGIHVIIVLHSIIENIFTRNGTIRDTYLVSQKIVDHYYSLIRQCPDAFR